MESKELKVKLDNGAYAPIREHSTDAGLDLKSREKKIIHSKSSEIFDTGIHVQLPPNTAGMIMSKSGLNVKHNITSTGLIDEGYTGSIIVKLYNHGDKDYEVKKGDKITQLVIVPVEYCTPKIVKDIDENSERGDKGFGSTGK